MMGGGLFQIAPLDRVWAVFDAYERDLNQIRVGTPFTFSLAGQSNSLYSGKIDFVSPVVDPAKRTFEVRGTVVNRKRLLKPDLYIEGELELKQSSSTGLTIPASAVLWTGRQSVVYRVVQNTETPTYEYVQVELGKRVGGYYQIVSGLDAGDEIVVEGAFSLDAAAQLNNQSSMMNALMQEDEVEEGVALEFLNADRQFLSQLDVLYEKYLELKTALVASDPVASKKAGLNMSKHLGMVSSKSLVGEAMEVWKTMETDLISGLAQIDAVEEDVEAIRLGFEIVSDAMITIVQSFDLGRTIFVQHCPMAFDDKGASWLSDENGILNPYFGDKMLRCGWVETIIE